MRQLINAENLKAGIAERNKAKGYWHQDFHNSRYAESTRLKKDGLTDSWWRSIVPILWKWNAIRPKSPDDIMKRGFSYLNKLNAEYHSILNKDAGREPTIESAEWDVVSPMFYIAHAIKGVDSPIFASKLCHFILPSLFPVADRDLVGMAGDCGDYEVYWTQCKHEWTDCPNKQELKEILGTLILAHSDISQIVPDYPWPTKIFELCYIGWPIQLMSANNRTID